MLLAGDIGGTKTALALFEPNDMVHPHHEQKFSSREYSGLEQIVEKYLSTRDEKITAACFGVAGPCEKDVCNTMNLPWVVETSQLSQVIGTEKVHLVNDLEAMAWSIEDLQQEDLYVLHKGVEIEENRGVIAAGTGLGEAGIWYGTKYHPFASEGGHSDFAPKTYEEDALLNFLRNKYQHVSWERVLSGPGIENIFEFLVNTYREKPNSAVLDRMKRETKAAVISQAAIEKECPACIRTMELFVSIYGAEAGNLALKLMAVGGMYIGGGIAPKILPLLDTDHFRESFFRKGRLRSVLQNVPVKVIMTGQAPLRGAAHVAAMLTRNEPIF